MKILLCADNSIGTPLTILKDVINSRCGAIKASCADFLLRLTSDVMEGSRDVDTLYRDHSVADDVHVFYITSKPFQDNFFYHGYGNRSLISLYGWSHLSDLPISNGVLYLIVTIILKYDLEVGHNHDHSTGCINDYMWDKTIINSALRSAYHCADCRKDTPEKVRTSQVYQDAMGLLDFISEKSRRNLDILDSPAPPVQAQAGFDVFLCHNSKDKEEVRRLNETLKAAGISTWLDEERLDPGAVWADELEQHIQSVRCCLVIVGKSGEGPWQEAERRAFINEFVNRDCRVIPVLIEGAGEAPDLPLLLKQFTWSDLRTGDDTQLFRLIGALRSLK